MARHEAGFDRFRAHSLSLTGDSAGGFPSAFALNGSACARVNMLDKFDLSDEKLRDALESSTEVAS